MLKNLLSSILYHFILGVAGYQFLLMDPKANELFYLPILLLLYSIGGYVLMEPQQSNKENFISISFLSVLLLLSAILCSLIAPNPTQNIVWIIYAFANAPAIAILFKAHSDLLFLVYVQKLPFPNLCNLVRASKKCSLYSNRARVQVQL